MKEIWEFLRHAAGSLSGLKAKPPLPSPSGESGPASRLRVGFGGDIPVSPPLFCLVCIGGGLAAPRLTGIDGDLFRSVVPARYYLPVRIGAALMTLRAARLKRESKEALEDAGTKADFQPVPSVADTGPYRHCRHPMYVALFAVPALVGFASDNFWVAIGSNLVLWFYLDFVVVPAEEKFLMKELGDSYKKYCDSIKRWYIF